MSSGQGLFNSVFKKTVTKDDISYITDFINKVNSGVPTTKAWTESMSKASVAGKQLAVQVKKGNVSLDSLKTSLNTSKVATIGLQAATLLLNAAFTMGLSFAITKGIELLNNWINAAQVASEKAQEIAAESKQAAESRSEEYDSIGDLINKYKELASGDTQNVETRQQIADIQSQIVDLVGNEADGIDLVNGKLDEQLATLLEIQRTKAQDRLYAARQQYTDAANAVDAYNNKNANWFFDFVAGKADSNNQMITFDYTDSNEQADAALEIINNALEKRGYGIAERTNFGDNFASIYLNGNLNHAQRKDALRVAIEALQNAQNFDTTTSDVFYQLLGIYNKMSQNGGVFFEEEQAAINLVDAINSNIIGQGNKELQSLEEYTTYRDEVITQILNDDQVKLAIQNGVLTVDGITSMVDSYLGTIPKYQNFYNQWKKTTDDISDTTVKTQPIRKSFEELNASVQSAMSVQASANKLFADNTYITEDTYNSLIDLVGGEEKLQDCIDTTNGCLVTNAQQLKKLIGTSNEALRRNVKLAASHEMLNYHKLTGQLQDVVSSMTDYGTASMQTVYTLLEQINVTDIQIAKYKLLEQQLLGVTNAFTALDEAKAVDAAADYTDELSGMIESLLGSFKNREFGTETFWTAFEALVPKDIYSQFESAGQQIDAGWKYINDKLSRYFTYDKSGKVSIDSKNATKFVEDALKTSYGDSTVFTGTIDSFQINETITSVEQLADAMGITTTAAFALGTAISKYSADNADFLSALSVETLEGQIYSADQKLVELLQHQAELGKSGKVGTDEWYEVRDAIKSANDELSALATQSRKNIAAHIEIDSNITAVQKEVNDLSEKLNEIDSTSPDYEITMSGYLEAEENLAALLKQKYALEAPTELTIQVALEQVQNEIDTAQNKLDEIATFDGKTYKAVAGVDQTEVDSLITKLDGLKAEESSIQMYVGIDDEDVLSSLETVQNFVIDDKNFSVSANLGSTLDRLGSVVGTLRNIQSKSVTITTNYVENRTSGSSSNSGSNSSSSSRGGGGRAFGSAHASGNWGIKRSEKGSLVGELGEELIVDPYSGKWYTVGENGAQLVDLPRGAIIFNHRQTEGLLKNKRINSRGQAYARGNAHFTFIDGNYDFGGGSGSSGGGGYNSPSSSASGSSSSNSGENELEVMDWIEIAISRIERAVGKLKDIASSAYKTLKSKLIATYDSISMVNEELSIQSRAYERYMAEANSVALSGDIKNLVRNGAIDISKYDSDTQKLIQDYKNWYEKALECADAIDTLHETLADLYKEKFDSIANDYSNKLEYDAHTANALSSRIDALKEKGYLDSTSVYRSLIETENDKIKTLNKEYRDLTRALNEAMASGEIEKYSDAWYEMSNKILDVKEEIDKANISLIEYENTMREIEWGYFDYTQKRIEQLTKESEFLVDLMSGTKLYQDNGQFSDTGMATLGLYGMNYNTYMNQADMYAKEAKKVNAEIAKDPNNTKLIERKEELLNLQRESISAAQKEKQSMLELVKNGITAQLNSLKDLIDKYNEALDSAKSFDDYQKKINDKTSELANIRKQLAAYADDDSEETRTTIQKLQVELQKAEDDLAETEYDQYITDQKKLLDDIYSEYESILNERIDNIDGEIEDIISSINVQADDIKDTLYDIASKNGYTLSDEMGTVWSSSASTLNNTLALYGDDFKERLTGVSMALEDIEANTAAMVWNSDQGGGIPAFASGGLAKYTGLAHLDGTPTRPELVLNPDDTERFMALMDFLKGQNITYGNSMPFAVSSMAHSGGFADIAPKLAQIVSQAGGEGNQQVNMGDTIFQIEIDHVQDYNDFVTKLQHDDTFEKMIQSMTLGRALGGNPFNKYKYQFNNR